MHTLYARNVNDALPMGLRYLIHYGVDEPSRNGPVLVAPGPVCTVYTHPWERVLFSPTRDANPFFHFFESLWMLAGRNDLAFLTQFVKTFGQFSDDERTVRGAYGHRWLKWFGYDQLAAIAQELRRDPASRRCVLTMWDAWGDTSDLLATSKDKPCNTHMYFDVRGGRLNMTVMNRSNDIWLGCYGANAVHMAFLQEYLASKVGVPMGVYRQVSNNYHLYTQAVPPDTIHRVLDEDDAGNSNLYMKQSIRTPPLGPFALVADDMFEVELPQFLDNPHGYYQHPYLAHVAQPMYKLWQLRDLTYADAIWADDWAVAGSAWVLRRQRAKMQKEAGTVA